MIASSNLNLANVYQGNQGFPGGSDCKKSAWNAEDLGLIPGWGRSPGEGNGNPLHYPMVIDLFGCFRGQLWIFILTSFKYDDDCSTHEDI